jgi:CubicO group peptidase (beta-lactamase class C family)
LPGIAKIRTGLGRLCRLCLVIVLSGCGSLSYHELDDANALALRAGRALDLKAEVDSLARPLIAEGSTPGLVVGVLTPDGRMSFFGYGVANDSSRAAPDGDTIFPVGSVSKGFVGAIAASLVEQGVLSWNDTLGELLPAEVKLSPDARRITLLQLATHTSGLPRQPINFQTFRYFSEFLFTGNNFYRHFDASYVFRYLARFKAPKRLKPELQYSNLGYGLLGYVLERRTGLPLETLLESTLVKPLRLTHTGYSIADLQSNANRASGHAGDQPKFMSRGAPVPDWQFTGVMKGSAGVYSSARDLLTFAAAHLGVDGIRPQRALADTLQVRLHRRVESPAVAWIVDEVNKQPITYQFGLVAGYTSYLGLDVQRRTAVVVLQNSFTWNDRIGHKLLGRLALSPAPGDKQKFLRAGTPDKGGSAGLIPAGGSSAAQ